MSRATAVRHLLFASFLAAAPTAQADDAKKPATSPEGGGAILSLGLGASSGGIVGVVSAQARRGSRLLGFRLAESTEFNLFGPSPALADTEFGLLYGRYSGRRAGFVTASAGLSVVRSVRRGRFLGRSCNSTGFLACLFNPARHERLVSHSLGVPFEARAVLASRYAGLGLGAYGNLSGNGSFVGIALTVNVGLLR